MTRGTCQSPAGTFTSWLRFRDRMEARHSPKDAMLCPAKASDSLGMAGRLLFKCNLLVGGENSRGPVTVSKVAGDRGFHRPQAPALLRGPTFTG